MLLQYDSPHPLVSLYRVYNRNRMHSKDLTARMYRLRYALQTWATKNHMIYPTL